jgi:putative phosphoesterase
MKIGLISDTHVPSYSKEPPPQVLKAFEGVDLILHAGDVYIQSCIDWLERIAPVRVTTSVRASMAEAAPRVSPPATFEIEGHTIGMIHQLVMVPLREDPYPGSIAKWYPPGESIPKELEEIFGKPVDIVVFGYTHEALVERHQGVLFINPGSTNMVKQTLRLGTVALLELTPQRAEARIIELSSIPMPE